MPIRPPPGFVLALAWRRDDRSAPLRGAAEFLKRYRDEHGWTSQPPSASSPAAP